jgi:hypothetical protein
MDNFKKFVVRKKVTDFITVEGGISMRDPASDIKNIEKGGKVLIKTSRKKIVLQLLVPFKSFDKKGKLLASGYNFNVVKPRGGFTKKYLALQIAKLFNRLKKDKAPSYVPIELVEIIGLEKIGSGHFRVVVDHESMLRPVDPPMLKMWESFMTKMPTKPFPLI